MTQEQKNVSIPGVTVNTSISTFPAPVGIGASDPQSVLHIVSQSPVVKVEDTASGTTASPTIQFLASDGTMGFVGYTGAYYGATGMHLLNVKSTPIFISTNNLERVRITASGNMGIGMTTPTTALGVSGSGSFSGIVSANGISAVGATFTGNISVGGIMVGRGTGTATDSVAVGQNALQLQTGSMNTAVGSNSLANAVGANGNVAVGMDSLRYNVSGSFNTAIGLYSQGLVAMTSAQQPSNNTSVGYASLALNQSGQYNVGLGAQAGQACTAGSQNTSVGYQALLNNWASNNIAVGFQALYGNTGGAQNIAIGVQALYANAANYNLAIGYQALNANDKGTSNVAVGHFALLGNTNGGSNTAIGHAAMQFNKSGSANTAIGDHALYSNDIGVNNTALGMNTLYSLTSGSFNVAIGNAALYNNTASNNTAIGEGSLYKNKTGGSNTSVGKDSLTQNISGGNNSAFGVNALGGNSGGSENTAIGTNAMLANISGIANTSVGMQTLAGNSGGNYNTGIGRSALGNNYDSSNNTAIGYAALHGNTAGGDSTAVGYQAGYLPTNLGTIVRGVFIGANSVGANPASSTDEIVIGAGATGIGNNTAVIGKSTQTAATIYGVVTASIGVTAPRMFTSSMTASALHVTGVATLAGVTAQSLSVSVGITAAKILATKLSVGATASIDFQDTLTVTPPFSEAPQGIGFYSAENLLRNGNFPDTTVGGVAEGWTVYGYPGASDTTTAGGAIWQAAIGGSGPRGVAAVVLTCNNGGGAYQTVNLTPGAVYTVSARIRVSALNSVDSSKAKFAIGVAGTPTSISDATVDVNQHDSGNSLNKWCYCSQTFTVPASALLTTPILVGVRSQGNTHSVQVTDIALYKGGIAKVFSPITVQEDTQQVLIGGNVGLGTATPSAKLYVVGESYVDYAGEAGITGGRLRFATNTTYGILSCNEYFDGTNNRFSRTGGIGKIRMVHTDAAGASAGSIEFLTGGTGTTGAISTGRVIMAMRPDGNVGIGTTTPAVALDVVGAISTSGNLKLTGAGSSLSLAYNSTDNFRGLLGWNTLQLGNNGSNRIVAGNTGAAGGGRLDFYVNNTTPLLTNSTPSDGITAMSISSLGRVGIRTEAPEALLEIAGTNAIPHLLLRTPVSSNTLPIIQFMEGTAKSWALVGSCNSSGTNGTFAIRDDYQSGTPVRLAITNAGNVGIGTTTPTVTLDVVGGIKASTTLNVAGVSTLAGVAAQSLTVSDGITATAINVSSYQLASTGFNNQTGTAYTILATDNGKIITGSNTAAITFTLPTATVGYSVTIIQIGTGAITIVAASGDTIRSFGKTSPLVTAGTWAAVDVVCIQANTWVLFGNLA